MAMMSVLGVLSGLAWSGLGYRGRKYVNLYLEASARIDEGAAEGCRVCKQSLDAREQLWFPFLGSFYILTFAPLLFSALYVFLFIVSVVQ
jgi:hypothetical protein